MQLSHQTLSIAGWLHEYDQQNSPQIYQVVNQIVNRKQQSQKRSVSLCSRRQDQESNKSILIKVKFQNHQEFQLLKIRLKNQKKSWNFYNTMNNINMIHIEYLIQIFLNFNQRHSQLFNRKKNSLKLDQSISYLKNSQQQNKRQLQPLQEINSTITSIERQQNNKINNHLKRTRFKTDQYFEILKSNSINRIQSIKDIMPKIKKNNDIPGTLNRGLEYLQQMVDKQKENVQYYLPKQQKYLK